MDATQPPAPDTTPKLPSFPRRFMDVFVSPGALAEALAKRPAWAVALVVGALLVVLQQMLIPVEVWEAAFRTSALERGQEMPEEFAMSGNLLRLGGLIGGVVFWFLFAFAMTGLVTLVFAFVLGDEGRYVQYLSVLSHAWLIPAVIGLLLLPLRISQQDPQLNLSVANFFFWMDGGYLYRVMRMLDLSQLWAWAVVAQGAHAIDPRRSFGSALGVLLVFSLIMALVFALFIPVG